MQTMDAVLAVPLLKPRRVLVFAVGAMIVVGCRASSSTSPSTEVVSTQSLHDASRTERDSNIDGTLLSDDEPPSNVDGLQDVSAWTVRLVLEHASHPVKNAPTVVVHAPPRYDPTPPIQVVVFLHGWSGCAAVLEATGLMACRPESSSSKALQGWGLGERHDAAGTNTLFLVPQLAFSARDGSPGRFAEKGFFREFLVELLAEGVAEKLGGSRSIDDVDHVTLVAHSAGFKTALAIMRQGGTEDLIGEVVLLDALYAAPAIFAQWVSKSPESRRRKVVSLYTAKGRTYQFSQLLARYAREQLGEDAVALDPAEPIGDSIRTHQVVIARSPVGHGSVPARHMAEVLGAFDLRRRDTE